MTSTEEQLRDQLKAAQAENEALLSKVKALKADLQFVADITGEELAYAKVGTGAEVALRHANRGANQGLGR